MKRKSALLPLLLFLAVAIIMAMFLFWLQPNLENQARSYLDALNAPDSPISIDYDKNALRVSPLARTVLLKSIVVTSRQAATPFKITIDNLTVQATADMLLLDFDKLPSSGSIVLASHVSMDNVSVSWPDGSLSMEHHESDNITCSANLLGDIVHGQHAPDILTALGQLGAERSASRNILYCQDQSTFRLSMSEALLREWNGRNIGLCAFSNMDLASQSGGSAHFAQLDMDKLHLPDAGKLAPIWQQLSAEDNLETLLPGVSNLLSQEGVPIVQQATLSKMTLHSPEGDITVEQANVSWPSARPQDMTCALKGLVLPAGILLSALQQEGLVTQESQAASPLFSGIETLHVSSRFAVKAQDGNNTLLHEQVRLDIPEWGVLDYTHLGDYANPAMGGKFRDLKLSFTDKSLLARSALVFFPGDNPERQISALLDSFSSSGTASLIETVKKFLACPGNLQISSLPNKDISESELFLIIANPAAYFEITATPGPKSLSEQCRELRKLR